MGISREEISGYVEELGIDGILLADGLEDAFIGVSCGFGPSKAVYDWDKCVEIFMTRDKMTYEEAVEWIDFNVTGAYVGEQTPEFISFSVKAAEEGKNRANIRLGLGFDEMPYFCTSHAFCKRIMGISQVMGGRDVFDFLEDYEFNLTKKYGTNARGLRSVVQDPYFDIIERAKANCCTLKEERLSLEKEQRKGVVVHMLEPIAEAWESFRLSRVPVVYSFADMINKFLDDGTAPELDLLIVDEAQDLAELNWRLVEKLALNAKKTYIAGDDDQAIYEWNGAKPQRFVNYVGL